jgi:hypothetical protein
MIVAFQPVSHGATGAAQSAVEDLGVTEGKPITNGFVFVDGKYVEPPYIVTRQGNGLLINGHLIEEPCPWPIPEISKPRESTTDPKTPVSIGRDTSKYNKDLINYIGEKIAYLKHRYGEEAMVHKMVQVYSNLPCIAKAEQDKDPQYIIVTWVDGHVEHIRLIPPKRNMIEWTREMVLERTDRDRSQYEERLNKGDYYFLGSAHGRMTGTADGARMVLGALLPILKTSRDANEVKVRMAQAGFVFFDDRAAQAFFSHRRDLSNLESRLNKLRQDKP